MTATVYFDLPGKTGQKVTLDGSNSGISVAKDISDCMASANPTATELMYARILLKRYPSATNISVVENKEMTEKQQQGFAAAIFIGFILAILFAPILVILGMRHKFLLKKLYANRAGDEYNEFVKKYMYLGIGLYAFLVLCILLGKIIPVLSVLITPALYIFVAGEIAYIIFSIKLTKKYIVETKAEAPAEEKKD